MSYKPIKLPLYIGKGEESDPQGRRSAGAFEAKGIRYFDKNSISAHRELTQRADISSGEFVVEDGFDILYKDGSGVSWWTPQEGSRGPLNHTTGSLVEERASFFSGRNVLFSKLLSVNGQLISITLAGRNEPESDNELILRVIDPDNNAPEQILTVNAAGYSTNMRVAEAGGTIVAMWDYNDTASTTYRVSFASFTASGGTWSFQNSFTHTTTNQVTGFDIVGASATQFFGAVCSGDTTTEVTELFDYNPVTPGITTNSYAVAALLGTDAIAVEWTGSECIVVSSALNADTFYWSFNTSLVAGATTALTGEFYGQGPTGTGRVLDIAIIPDGSVWWVAITGLWAKDGTTPDDNWGADHFSLGTSVFRSDSLFSTLTNKGHIGSGALAGEPWVSEAGVLEVPVVWDAGYPQAAAIDRTPFVWLAGTLHLPEQFKILSNPTYGGGLVVRVGDTSAPEVVSVWGIDEAFVSWKEVTPDLALDYDLRAYRAGDTVLHNGTQYLAYPVVRSNEFPVTQLYSVASGANFATTTPAGVVATLGGTVSLVDDQDIEQIALIAPPVVMVYRNSDTPAAIDPPPTNYAFLRFTWVWIDSRGVAYRSPPSQESVWPDINNEGLRALVTPPPPLTCLQNGKLMLEVWSDTFSDAKTVQTGVYRFIDRIDVDSNEPLVFSLDTAFADPEETTRPLLYTTGGVLPQEAPAVGSSSVVAGTRFWYTRGNKAFYSKEMQKGLPLSFNSNLFVSAPDGKDIVALAELDEQAILFTDKNVFIVRGRGPTNTGQGNGFVVHSLPSPTGCLSRESVVSTEHGVMFLGHRGIHLVQRNMSVVFVGHPVTDTLDNNVSFSFYDKQNKEAQWYLSTGGMVSFQTETGLWAENTGTTFVDGVFSVSLGRVCISSDGIFTETAEEEISETGDTWAVGDNHPFTFSTPWIDLGDSSSGYHRLREILIQGRAQLDPYLIPAVLDEQQQVVTPESLTDVDPRAALTVRLYKDLETTPIQTQTYDLRAETLDPLHLKLQANFRKFTNFRVELEIPAFAGEFVVSGLTASVRPSSVSDKGYGRNKYS